MTAADPAPALLTLIALLRRDAESVSDASKMLATDKSRRNQNAGDAGASYDWLQPQQTTQWKAADALADLAAKLAEAERLAERWEHQSGVNFNGYQEHKARADRAEAAQVAAQEAMRKSVRPEVTAFAMLMERELRANDHKTSWRKMSIHDLEKRLREEVDELSDASRWRSGGPTEGSYARHLGSECADVANFAMMIADVAGALPIPAAKPEGE
jgi:NTP pyrophosphatase (non-canonical NTP hydrolase)